MSNNTSAAGGGLGLGGLMAAILSWTVNHSILYCLLHCICSWFYVIYWVIEYSAKF